MLCLSQKPFQRNISALLHLLLNGSGSHGALPAALHIKRGNCSHWTDQHCQATLQFCHKTTLYSSEYNWLKISLHLERWRHSRKAKVESRCRLLSIFSGTQEFVASKAGCLFTQRTTIHQRCNGFSLYSADSMSGRFLVNFKVTVNCITIYKKVF